MIVAKFGGGAMATSSSVKKVIEMIRHNPARRIIVVSAPGARKEISKNDPKVTDLLIACANSRDNAKKRAEIINSIAARYEEIVGGLAIDKSLAEMCRSDLEKRVMTDDPNQDRYMDMIKAFGEEYSARFFAAALTAAGLKAKFVSPQEAGLYVTPEYAGALPLEKSAANLATLARTREIIVFPGFYGITEDGHIATFSRGGSDLTGSILAAAVNADVYENFTDVPGIFAVNPKYLTTSKPRKIDRLTFDELRELSYSGFTVFHDEAIMPIMNMKKPVPIHVRDYRHPDLEGTLIVGKRKSDGGKVVGIAADTGFISFTVSKMLMNREIGFGRKLLGIFESRGLSYEHSPSGIDTISVVLKEGGKFDAAFTEAIVKDIYDELNVDNVKIERNLAMLVIVGQGMKESVGMASRATAAIARAHVNIEMISQGASEISICFGIKSRDVAAAVTCLYNSLIRYAKTPYLAPVTED